jgi:hypothetical protein
MSSLTPINLLKTLQLPQELTKTAGECLRCIEDAATVAASIRMHQLAKSHVSDLESSGVLTAAEGDVLRRAFELAERARSCETQAH